MCTKGRAGHSARPSEGHNAIYDMVDIVQGIKEKLIPLYEKKKHLLLGNPTINVGKINGGILVNIIPDKCSIEIDRRLIPGENWGSVQKEFEMLILDLKKRNSNLDVEFFEPSVIDEGMDTDTYNQVVKTSLKICKEVVGYSDILGVSYCCDATKFYRSGIPSIVLGPGNILQAHTAIEYVDIKELTNAAEIYAQICSIF